MTRRAKLTDGLFLGPPCFVSRFERACVRRLDYIRLLEPRCVPTSRDGLPFARNFLRSPAFRPVCLLWTPFAPPRSRQSRVLGFD